jgi:hypothetical protein
MTQPSGTESMLLAYMELARCALLLPLQREFMLPSM